MPIPLIKDLIQFEALRTFGSWWADLDSIWTGRKVPDSVLASSQVDASHSVVLFSEPERSAGQFVLDKKLLIWQNAERPRATLNIGLAFSVAGAAFWAQCSAQCSHYWRAGAGRFVNWDVVPEGGMRKHKHWNR